jgi:parallel beta-helix repeat protein
MVLFTAQEVTRATRRPLALLAGALGLSLVVGVSVAGPAGAAIFCVNPGGTGGCQSSINAAVALADATGEPDTIDVAAGTYAELVAIPATESGLTINGANADVNPCTTARGAESIVGVTTGGFHVAAGADDTTINGFTIQGVMDVPGSFAAGVHATGSSGTSILDNVVQNNVIGVAIGGSGVLVQNNDIRNNNNPGSAAGTGVYSDTGLTGSTIDGNCFTGHQNQTTNIIGAPVFGLPVSDITLSNNTATSDSGFAFFGGSNLTVTGNENVDNVIAASYFFDSVTTATITGNLSLDGFRGIRVNNTQGTSVPSTGITASCNRLVGHETEAINVEAGTHSGTLVALNNWYGCNEGPATTDCDPVAGDVDADPWLVLTLDVDPPLVPAGGDSTLTASLSSNSDGGAPSCTVPDGTPVSFDSTCGAVNPTDTTTNGGTATSTLTGGAPGSCQASTTVDSETVVEATEVVSGGGAVSDIPTASTLGLMLLGLVVAGVALVTLRRR